MPGAISEPLFPPVGCGTCYEEPEEDVLLLLTLTGDSLTSSWRCWLLFKSRVRGCVCIKVAFVCEVSVLHKTDRKLLKHTQGNNSDRMCA